MGGMMTVVTLVTALAAAMWAATPAAVIPHVGVIETTTAGG